MLYTSENKLLCIVCNSSHAKSKEEPWCLECEQKAEGFLAVCDGINKEISQLSAIWQFLFMKGIPCNEIKVSIDNLKLLNNKIQNHVLYKIEYSKHYSVVTDF